MGAKDELKKVILEVFSTGEGKPEVLADKLADAIDKYFKSKLTSEVMFSIPVGGVVINVVGQAAGIKNPTPIKIEVKVLR